MHKLKLTSIGSSTGIVIPKAMLARMRLKRGDVLFVTETPGGYLLTPYDPAIEEQLNLGRELMGEYGDTFRALAK